VRITRTVITAAGCGARRYPAADTVRKDWLPMVDRDGLTMPVLPIIAEEAFESEIEEIGDVSAPGDEPIYRDHLRNHAENLRSAFRGLEWAEEQALWLVELEQRLWFADRPDPLGYRHAVWSARPLIEDEPFLLLLGDHLSISSEPRRRGRQLLDLTAAEDCAVSAVRATREHLIHQYSTLPGKRRYDRPDVYAIEEIKDVKDGQRPSRKRDGLKIPVFEPVLTRLRARTG